MNMMNKNNNMNGVKNTAGKEAIKQHQKEHPLENTMGNLLRAGVLSSAVLVFIGAVYYLMNSGSGIPDYSVFRGVPDELTTLDGIVNSVLQLKSRGVIMLGIVVLILTPIARVVFSLIAFLLKKDYIYTVISTIVLTILLLSFFDVI